MFNLIQGNLKPEMQMPVTLNSVAVDLSTAVSVDMLWKKPDASETTVSLTVIAPATSGLTKRTWVAGDSDMVGVHRGRVVVTWPGGLTQTFPVDGSWNIWWVNAAT